MSRSLHRRLSKPYAEAPRVLAAVLLMTISIEAAIRTAFPVGSIGTPVTSGDLAIVHVNVVEESARHESDVLLQRYPFGWQMIEYGDPKLTPCQLTARGANAQAVGAFSKTIGLRPDDPENCASVPRDAGPLADLIAIRSIMNPHQLTPKVRVDGSYAVGWWFGWGGGEWIFAKRNGAWKRIGGGGGAFAASDLKALGIPTSVAAKLLEGEDAP